MSAGGADIERDWQAVRASADIQYAPLPPIPAPHTPAWLEWLAKALQAVFGPAARLLVAAWPVLQYVLIGAGVALALWLVWRLLAPVLGRRRHDSPEEAWAPARAEALALLADADRLADEGRYGEAAHLLLQRSVGQIRAARPQALIPASTAREIASLPQLPSAARGAFGTIAGLVERCLFALRDLNADDWSQARAAYSAFALADLRP